MAAQLIRGGASQLSAAWRACDGQERDYSDDLEPRLACRH